jgi:catechol 2,3-dioxygenase-like lactoylglutathione lyase family enzyme
MALDHIGFNVADVAACRDFCVRSLKPRGIVVVMQGEGFVMVGRNDKPSFWFGSFGEPAGRIRIAFAAANREQVRAFYIEACAAGGKDNGPPGLREHYHPNHYGAFVIGPDGNNVEAVCHEPQA